MNHEVSGVVEVTSEVKGAVSANYGVGGVVTAMSGGNHDG